MHQVKSIFVCSLSIADKSLLIAENKACLIMAMDVSEMLTFLFVHQFKLLDKMTQNP